MLYWATSTPNLGVEVLLGKQTTLSLTGGYNPFVFSSRVTEAGVKVNPKFRHFLVMPEFKYWFCRSFERGYLGVHAIYGMYNIGGFSFANALKDHRYEGYAYGGGVSWGYQWALGKRFGVEVSLGAGYLYIHYRKYDCGNCGGLVKEGNRHYFGPTKAALSLIYYLR